MSFTGEPAIKKLIISLLALAATACAVIFMIVSQPPAAKKVVKREAPSRTLAYEQAISIPASDSEEGASDTAPTPPEGKPEGKAKATQPKPAKVPDEPPAQEQAAVEPPEERASEAEEMPWLRDGAGAPPRVATVPPQGYDPYAPQPPMDSVPQSHETWAPPDEESSNESFDQGAADQWDAQGNDQGNNRWANAPPGQGNYPPQDQRGNPQTQDQWGNQQQPDQWGNAPRDQWGNPQPRDQWGNQMDPYGQNPNQWADPNTETGEQWAQVVLSGAEMRSAAADDAPLLFAFPYGRNLRVVSRQGEWAEVTDPQSSATGWMKLQNLAPAGSPHQGYQQPQYDAYYQEPPQERRGLFRGGFADMINRAFGGGN